MTLAQEYLLLSQQFRAKFATLSDFQRLQIEKTMLETFSAVSLRNVQLWTRSGASQRQFVNAQVDPKERERRQIFARAIINDAPINRPQKESAMGHNATLAGQKLLKYLIDPWIGGGTGFPGALRKIYVDSDGSLIVAYDSESNGLAGGYELTPDDPEFDDLFDF